MHLVRAPCLTSAERLTGLGVREGTTRSIQARLRAARIKMLNFPNASRAYDATRRCVRFWGYDGALEIPFFVEDRALVRIAPGTTEDESSLLKSFDGNRDRIFEVARRVYLRRRKGSYELIASDF
jgi:hypothetical protein